MNRVAAALLWLLWSGLMSASLVIRWRSADPRLPEALAFSVVMLMFATTGAVLLAARMRNPIGWLVYAIALIDALNRLGLAVAAGVPEIVSASPPVAMAVALAYVLSQNVGFTLISLLLLLFPEGRLLSSRWRVVAILPVVLGVAAATVTLFAAGPVRPNVGELAKPFGVPALVPLSELLKPAGVVAVVLGILLGVVSLFRRYRTGGAVQRQQIKWMAVSGALVALFFLTLVVLIGLRSLFPAAIEDRVVEPILAVGNLVAALSVPVAIALAVLRYRLYDIDLVINRTLVYGAVSALLVTTYFGSVLLLQTLLRPFTTGGSELAVAGSTLAVVALAAPLRRRIQGAVDRRFYRSRYDAARTLDAFGARLRDEVELDAVRADLLDVIHDTIRPAHASVWLRERARPGP